MQCSCPDEFRARRDIAPPRAQVYQILHRLWAEAAVVVSNSPRLAAAALQRITRRQLRGRVRVE